MREIKNIDGSWVKVETKNRTIEYTDSDGVWMKEKYNKDGRIVSRLDSFGVWDKYRYRQELIPGKGKPKYKTVIDSHTTGCSS